MYGGINVSLPKCIHNDYYHTNISSQQLCKISLLSLMHFYPLAFHCEADNGIDSQVVTSDTKQPQFFK